MSAETQRLCRRGTVLIALLLVCGALRYADAMAAQEKAALVPPAWAYPVNPPGFQPSPMPDIAMRVQGSSRRLRGAQLNDLFNAPDWHPEEHPPLPVVVAQGRKPALYACGYCHRANGAGGPENASLAGLPFDYIVQQMRDFRSGARRSSLPERLPPKFMAQLSQAITEPEIREAATYFSTLRPLHPIAVVETERVPLSYVAGWFLAASDAAPREPIGSRIIEVPRDLAQFEKRDSRARFVAYVPVGSIRAGKRLVEATGAAAPTHACSSCHGPRLKGAGAVPAIGGRSPSYIFRQLFDMKNGSRAGAGAAPMQTVVRALSIDDMRAIAAYVASIK